jgi:hypothetical protein
MVSKSKPRGTPKSGRLAAAERAGARVGALLRMRNPQRFDEVRLLKQRLSPSGLFNAFPHVFPTRDSSDELFGNPFPRTLSELFQKPAISSNAGPLNEIVWAISRCLQYSKEVRSFVEKRDQFEAAILRDDRDAGSEALSRIADEHGASIWSAQNLLLHAFNWTGPEASREKAKELDAQAPSGLVAVLLRFTARRVEATGLKNHLKGQLSEVLDPGRFGRVERYARTKLFELSDVDVGDVAITLQIESQSCVVDLYETLTLVLQSLATNDAFYEGNAILELERPLSVLYRHTGDRRLLGVLRALGSASAQPTVSPSRARLIEMYTKGGYSEFVREAENHIVANPTDVPMTVLLGKASAYAGCEIPPLPGINADIARHISNLVTFKSEEAFASAFEIVMLAERFYGHAWMSYVRSAVLYEVRREEAKVPPAWLRDMYVRDHHVTPFAAFASRGEARKQILSSLESSGLFPCTLAIYNIFSGSKVVENDPIQQGRTTAYIARHHLARGDKRIALESFQWLMANASGIERSRAAGGAALAAMAMGEVRTAVECLVRGYFRDSHASTILPIKDVCDRIGEPAWWPNNIHLPLVLELYYEFVGPDKLSHLRYAFETFLGRHEISTPQQLAERCEELGGKKAVVAFLDKVWRPEVMRQTILYQGTREIEEARIQVCRVLASIDPANETHYLSEIRERVKRLEISKGTSLVQQSKVYVDLESIKRSLRARLSEPYARYKAAVSVGGSTRSELYRRITDVIVDQAIELNTSIARILSEVHVLEDASQSSQSDAQFAAIYAEVINEFLRGDHGLNAYLSTRVRHGTLSNTLRKPVADERLITQKVSDDSDVYVPNTHWFGTQPSTREKEVLSALEEFGRSFDAVLKYLNDTQLQIRIIHELTAVGGSVESLFTYSSSNLERLFVQEFDQRARSVDDLIDKCVEVLWEKTDENLAKVRRVLDTEIRERLGSLFEALSQRIGEYPELPGYSELVDAILRARTGTNARLSQVASWFKRSEVYDRYDYSADLPIAIAVNIVSSTNSRSSHWTGLIVDAQPDLPLLPGRSLDTLVDVYYALIENALTRAGLLPEQLKMTINVAVNAKRLEVTATNNLAPTKPSSEERARVSELRQSLNKNESRRRAQLEGGSGLLKIWRAIGVPPFRNSSLDFGYLKRDDAYVFYVTFGAAISEEDDNETVAH